jgi:hypothetical protein
MTQLLHQNDVELEEINSTLSLEIRHMESECRQTSSRLQGFESQLLQTTSTVNSLSQVKEQVMAVQFQFNADIATTAADVFSLSRTVQEQQKRIDSIQGSGTTEED